MHASYMDLPTPDLSIEKGIPFVPALTLLVNSLESATIAAAAKDAMQRELHAAVSNLSKA